MTRRLVLALLGFTTVVLLLSIVPLGVATASRDHSDYASGTRALSQSLATLAEDSFDDTRKPLEQARLAKAAGPGVSAAVFDLTGAVRVRTGVRRVFPPAVLAAARTGRTTSVNDADDVVAATPVIADGRVRGVVVVARADEAVERRVTRLWLALAAVAAVTLLLSVVIAVGTAQWVGRPLRRLRNTAQRWSDGSLHERADPSGGPPEIGATAAALNVMAGRLDTLVHGSRAVVADVSHQLRTPLAAMRLRLELLRGELNHDRHDQALDDDLVFALAEIDRLSRLVDGLLVVARAESAESRPEPVDVGEVVRERRQAWDPVAAERGIEVVVTTPPDAVASITPGQLEQVLDNLLDNSLEAMTDGGRVDVTVERARDAVRVRVHDNGPGMTEEQQAAAFHRFVTGRTAGTGLGLAVVHRLVTADGGTVHLESAVGAGTTVTIELPPARSAS